MGQRKLTREELQHAERAAWYLQSVMNECGLIANGGSVLDQLCAIAAHGTTDGNPYVEPQPEIGDGYRRATWADAGRRDVEYFSQLKGNRWIPRSIPHAKMQPEYHYRVPADRIPTDEDARQRPTVMVRDNDKQDWQARKLLAVTGCLDKFVTSSSSGVARFWMQARFPYPGELD